MQQEQHDRNHPNGTETITMFLTREKKKVTTDIQAAGQTANRLCPAYQYTALSASPHTQTHIHKPTDLSTLSVSASQPVMPPSAP